MSGLGFELESWIVFVARESQLARVEHFLDQAQAGWRYDELAATSGDG